MALAYTLPWLFTNRKTPWVENNSPNYPHYQQFYWELKELFKDMGWVVRSSNKGNGTFGNNDYVDHWVTPGDIYIPSGSWSVWTVMESPAGSPAEICFGWNYSSGQANMIRFVFAWSPSAGFGSGTGTGNPTATDEILNQTWASSTTTLANSTFSMHGAYTADGKHFRVNIKQQRVWNMSMGLETLVNPHANLENDQVVWARIHSSVADPSVSVLDNDWYTSALLHGRVSGAAKTFYMGTPGYGNAGLQSKQRVYDDAIMRLTKSHVYLNDAAIGGFYGTIPDMYFGKNNHFGVLLGDALGGPAKWLSGGSIVTPWDSAEPKPREY